MTLRKTTLAALAIALLIGAVAATLGPRDRGLPPLPDPGDPVTSEVTLLHAQPFQLDEPYTHWWRAEAPEVASGWVLVLASDPDLVRPRQTAEPVLYVGAQTAERCNAPTDSGHLVVLVPAPLAAGGTIALDPYRVPIWFGDPDLPERVDAAEIRRQLEAATARGVGPARRSARLESLLDAASAPGTIYARDRLELDLVLADLIELYSPDEVDLVEGLRLPVTR